MSKTVKKSVLSFTPRAMNVILYDDENIKYYHGVFTNIETSAKFDSGSYLDGSSYCNVFSHNICFEAPALDETENITLDDTLMKRIAKFNKEQECKRLDEKIKDKREKIEELDALLHDKEKRWEKVQKYIAKIYEIPVYEDDDCDDYEDF